MDSATQFLLGAAVAQAVLDSDPNGRHHRWWRLALGGLLGTLPDLDMLCTPFLDGPTALGFHRGVTHSLFFCTLVTPLLAWVCQRLWPRQPVSWQEWLLCVWLGLNTHWMIDSLTQYGTQVLLPFSDHPVNISSVFIIDPIYTTILALCLWAAVRRSSRRVATVGLMISSGYLLLTLVSKTVVLDRLQRSLDQQQISVRQLITVPTPFNSILWYGYADLGDDVLVTDSSLLDSPRRPIRWLRVSKNHQALEQLGEGPAEQRLLWFSRGFYRVELCDQQPIWIDLRFGRLASWLEPDKLPSGSQDFIFRYALLPSKPHGPYQDFKGLRPQGSLGQFPWKRFGQRILGVD